MPGMVMDRPNRAQIQKQIVLPWSRTFQMTKESIFVRLGRSIITASGIFLGIAFMCAVFFRAAGETVAVNIEKQKFGLVASSSSAGDQQARVIWLVSMSLVVATVGIVNSMLMSVTERYKEIGTMKCLGALDKFIVRLFILEAMLLGVLASVIGALAGTGLMQIVYISRIGFGPALSAWVATTMTIGSMRVPLWAAVIFAVLIGGILSVLAAIYPAWRAAKMPPAAALRSEF